MTTPIADQLREAALASGLSARELAKRADLVHTAVNRFMKAQGGITLESAEKLADALGVKLMIRK